MDATAIAIVIDNDRELSREAYASVIGAMTVAGKMPGQPGDQPGGANYDTAGEVGDVIETMIKDHARAVYGWQDDQVNPEDLTARLWFTAVIDHTDWREVGAHFYTFAREQY